MVVSSPLTWDIRETAMLIIRKEQIEILGKYMEEQFVECAVRFIGSAFAHELQGYQDHNLHSMVREGISKAREYGIEYKDDVMRFLEFMIKYGSTFFDDKGLSEVREILNKDIDGTAKIILLEDYFEAKDKELTWQER